MNVFQDLSLPITNPVLIVALVLLVVLVAPLLFARLRMPGLVGLIIAGVLVGPHTSGLLARDLTIVVLGTVGLLYIMFLAGLEVNLHEFDRYRRRSAAFGALTFILPQTVGTVMAIYILEFSLTQAILLGSIFASHTLLAYPIVSRLGVARSQVVTTAVGGTIITDTAALLVLAVVARTASGSASGWFWMLFAGLLVFYTVGLFWAVPRLARFFFRRVGAEETSAYVFILTVVFSCAFLAELVGVEAIIGAFLAGLALNRFVPDQSLLMSRIRFVGEALFIPFFLISVGMLVDPGVLAGGVDAWVVAVSMIVTVVLTKGVAAMACRPLFGYSVDESWMLFGLTVPQAAATLAAVIIGFEIGLLGEEVLNGTILMILVTCVLGPWVAEKSGRRVALAAADEPYEPSSAPQRILVPLANPQSEPHLIELATLIRDASSDEPLYPMTVARDGPDVQSRVAAGEKVLAQAVMHATAANIPVHPVIRVDLNLADGILRAVKERLISTVIVGWGGRVLARHLIYGSVLDQLVSASRELLLVCKIEHPLNTCRRIVLVVPPDADREAGFARALRPIKLLASRLGAGLLIVASDDWSPALRRRIEMTVPNVPAEYESVGSWDAMPAALDGRLMPDDLLVLISVREGTRVWQPMLSRLPAALSEAFAATSIISAYLPLAHIRGTVDTLPVSESKLTSLLAEDQVVVDVQGPTQEAVLRDMLRNSLWPEPGMMERAMDVLARAEPAYDPELHPDAIFFHAHLAGMGAARLFVGTSRIGLPLPEVGSRVHVIVVLLSPQSDRPQRHLRRLTAVAHLIHSDETVARLRDAVRPSEVLHIIAENGEPIHR